jgi:hypothetical protein
MKVFGLGLNKTGTTSLMHGLQILGMRVCNGFGPAQSYITKENYQKKALELVPHFDAFEDLPWPFLYKELYESYPDSVFILTVRPVEAWWRSFSDHFGKGNIEYHQWMYGYADPVGREKEHKRIFLRHNDDVRTFFKQKPNFAELNFDGSLNDRELWGLLCGVLGVAVPDRPFPKSNRTLDRKYLDYLRKMKHFVWGKKPIKFLGRSFGTDYSDKQ